MPDQSERLVITSDAEHHEQRKSTSLRPTCGIPVPSPEYFAYKSISQLLNLCLEKANLIRLLRHGLRKETQFLPLV